MICLEESSILTIIIIFSDNAFIGGKGKFRLFEEETDIEQIPQEGLYPVLLFYAKL